MRSASQIAMNTDTSCANAIHVVIVDAVATDPRKTNAMMYDNTPFNMSWLI
jgi:hypothetical protein